MKPLLNIESDDEYFDDPIKLFDSEHDRVHFGILPQGTGIACNSYLSKGYLESDDELSETDGSAEDFVKTVCLPSYVKLVNCAQFPWYFKKYYQQILEKATIFDLASDSDTEFSVEPLENPKDDCFIVNEIITEPQTTKSEDCDSDTASILFKKIRTEKRQVRMKHKEDMELQTALSQKNTGHVDLKRNKGLIGMTVTQKLVKDIGSGKGPVIRNKPKTPTVKDVSDAARRLLIRLKTRSKAIGRIKEHMKPENHQMKQDANDSTGKVPVKFNLETMSENLLKLIKTKTSNHCQETKQNTEPNVQTPSIYVANVALSPDKIKNCMLNTADPESTLFNIQTPKTKEDEMTKNFNVEPSKSKNINCIRKSSSPILHCSLAKKNKSIKQSVKVNKNILKADEQNEHKYINMTDNLDTENESLNKTMKKNVVPRLDPEKGLKQGTIKILNFNSSNLYSGKNVEKLSPTDKNNQQVTSPAAQEERCNDYKNNHKISITYTGSDSLSVNPTIKGKECISQSNFMNPDYRVISVKPNLKYTNGAMNVTSKPSTVESTQRIDVIPNINSNAARPTQTDISHIPYPKPTTAVSHHNITTPIRDHGKSLPLQTITSAEVNPNYLKKPNDGTYRTLTGVLGPTQPNSFYSNARCNHPGPNPPENIPVLMQPRFYHNPYTNNFNTLPHNSNQRYAPPFANCGNSNYRFPNPQGNNIRPWPVPPPYPNIIPNSTLMSEYPTIPRFSSQLSVSVSQTPPATSKSQLEFKSHPNNILLTKFSTQQQQKAKPKILDPRITKKTDKDITVKNGTPETNSSLVTSKTKMLELLDSSTNDLKRCVNNSEDITSINISSSFKKPKLSNEATLNETSRSKYIDPQKGYSLPILPIPTYEKVLGNIITNKQSKDMSQGNVKSQTSVSRNMTQSNDFIKKTVSEKSQLSVKKGYVKKNKDMKSINDTIRRPGRPKMQEGSKKQNVKKISLEEYKNRTNEVVHAFLNNSRYKPKDNSEIYNKRAPVQSKPKSTVDRFSTESDLGYDSDSTVIL